MFHSDASDSPGPFPLVEPKGASSQANALLTRLQYPQFLPAGFGQVQLVETHISVILLGQTQVLKLKKPVQFDFLDHRSFERRATAVIKEVVLNRRLSSDIYQGIMEVARDRNGRSVSRVVTDVDDYRPADHVDELAVLMRRIPSQARLDELIRLRSTQVAQHITSLAESIRSFHNTYSVRSLTNGKPTPSMVVETLHHQWNNNIRVVQKAGTPLLPAVMNHAVTLVENFGIEFFEHFDQMLLQRVLQGCFVDGHGDLRAEHIYVEGEKISVIDCIEFNDSLRTIDRLNDIAFLRVDLDYLGRPDLSQQFVSAYNTHPIEKDQQELLDFYSVYRGMVRAKVALLTAQQFQTDGENTMAGDYVDVSMRFLAFACRYTLKIHGSFLLGIGGLMGAGKSTLADFLYGLTAANLLRTDELRKQLFISSDKDKQIPFRQGKYSEEATTATYKELFKCAEPFLKQGNPVILDASFSRTEHRAEMRMLANRCNIPCLFVHCVLEDSILRTRLRKRELNKSTVSDGRVALLDKQKEIFENPDELSPEQSIEIDTSFGIHTQAEKIIQVLRMITKKRKPDRYSNQEENRQV